jgi:hypothetical protein
METLTGLWGDVKRVEGKFAEKPAERRTSWRN